MKILKIEMKTHDQTAPNECGYKNHIVNSTNWCHYWDDKNGIPEKGIHMCRECYAEHILKFYPDGLMAEHIKENPNDYKNR